MSRTYNTDPFWVKGLKDSHRTIHHHWKCEENVAPYYPSEREPCSIDEPHSSSYRSKCEYYPSSYYGRYPYIMGNAPKWYRQHIWENPKRVEERDKLGKAVKEYNSTGEVDDIIFEHTNHRHNANWYWW